MLPCVSCDLLPQLAVSRQKNDPPYIDLHASIELLGITWHEISLRSIADDPQIHLPRHRRHHIRPHQPHVAALDGVTNDFAATAPSADPLSPSPPQAQSSGSSPRLAGPRQCKMMPLALRLCCTVTTLRLCLLMLARTGGCTPHRPPRPSEMLARRRRR